MSSARPEWESTGELCIDDAIRQVMIAYGLHGFVEVRARSEVVPSGAERLAAIKTLHELGEAIPYLQESDFPDVTIATFREMQNERSRIREQWYLTNRQFTEIAYPFVYIVGRADDSANFHSRREYVGNTWEEAMEHAHILGVTERLKNWMF